MLKFTTHESYCFTLIEALIVFVLTRQETIKNNNTEQYLLFSNSGRFSWFEQNQDLSRRLTKFLVEHSLPHLLATFLVNCSFLCRTKRKNLYVHVLNIWCRVRGYGFACEVLATNLYSSPYVRWSWFPNMENFCLWNPEFRERLECLNPSSTDKECEFRYLETWIHSVKGSKTVCDFLTFRFADVPFPRAKRKTKETSVHSQVYCYTYNLR